MSDKKVKHEKGISRDQLETNLNFQEAIWRKLTALAIVGDFTVSSHNRTTSVPRNSLKLVLDPNGPEGALEPPEGTTLICRGEAWISDAKSKVAAFRKAPA